MLAVKNPDMIIRIPAPHAGGQEIFFNWADLYPEAQVLVAPCGTKVGKTFGAVLWMIKEATQFKNLYCAWIAPTYLKCRIAYRYMKAMLPACDQITFIDGRLEIQLANGSFIKFMHGSDAEVTVEGEAIDRFVIDEAGKIAHQVWISILTTITQTIGIGIVTGTPRGKTWYYDLACKAEGGDPLFVYARIPTKDSPFVTQEQIERSKRLMPYHLYLQYYEAMFVSSGSVFGDLTDMWTKKVVTRKNFWIHPDKKLRSEEVVHGIDVAKKHDYSVYYSINLRTGHLVGFCRYNHVSYPHQVIRLKTYLNNYFIGDNIVKYDATGVGDAFGDALAEADIPASIDGVIFSNRSKAEMVTKTVLALQTGWHKAPYIKAIDREFTSYELTVTPSGLHKYAAPEGEHDDIVSAALIAITEAYSLAGCEKAEKVIQAHMSGDELDLDAMNAYTAMAANSNDDDFFEQEDDADDLVFDYENE